MLTKVDCLLDCGCEWNDNGIAVAPGDEVTCRFHGSVLVKIVGIGRFQVSCQDCTYHSHDLRLGAERRAISHRKRRPGHTVIVYTPEGKVHHVFQTVREQSPPLF